MIKGKQKERISLQALLSKITEYDIYRYYLGHDFKVNGDLFKSPFRDVEKDGSFGVFVSNKTGVLCHNDFGDNSKSGTCIDLVKQLFNINYYEALVKIDLDFNLGLSGVVDTTRISYKDLVKTYTQPEELIIKKERIIQIIPKKFTKEELAYWKQYEITEKELIHNNVYSISRLYVDKRVISNYSKELRFAYKYDNYLKIYSPHNERYKWISNTPNEFISNLDEIKDKLFTGKQDRRLIIGKSKKDEMVLRKFFDDVCSTQNESHTAINLDNITLFSKYREVLINYDADEPGVRNCTYYNQYGFNYFNTPNELLAEGIKDISDMVKIKGIGYTERFLLKKGLI